MTRLAFVFVILSCVTAQARLGETFAECETRYGPVVEKVPASQKDSDKQACVFSKGGITILAEFRDGKVWKITYTKVAMDVDEVETLLSANAGAGTWSPPLKIMGQDVRTTSDHERISMVVPSRRPEAPVTLVVASKAFAKASRAFFEEKLATVPDLLKNRTDSKALNGF